MNNQLMLKLYNHIIEMYLRTLRSIFESLKCQSFEKYCAASIVVRTSFSFGNNWLVCIADYAMTNMLTLLNTYM